MTTLPAFRDLPELLALIDRAAQHDPAPEGFLDCRGVLHRWDEED